MPKLLSQKKKKIYLFDFYSVIIYQPRYLAQEPQKKEKEKKKYVYIYIYIYIWNTHAPKENKENQPIYACLLK